MEPSGGQSLNTHPRAPAPPLGPRNRDGLGLSHLGQLLAEPQVLLAELPEGLGSLSPTVLLLRALFSKLGPQGLHIPLQLHSPGLPLSSPCGQAPAELVILLLQPLWGQDRRSERGRDETNKHESPRRRNRPKEFEGV